MYWGERIFIRCYSYCIWEGPLSGDPTEVYESVNFRMCEFEGFPNERLCVCRVLLGGSRAVFDSGR